MNRESGFKLDDNEHIKLEVRKHWISLGPSFVSAGLLILIAIGFAYGIGRYPHAFGPALPLVALMVILFIFISASIVAIGLWVYRQNRLILTNLHLIQVEQNGIFHRIVSQLSLAKVQDVSGSSKGLVQTVLGYGDVIVQTAGEQDKFSFEFAPGPATIADQCLQAHEEFMAANPTVSRSPD